MEIKHKILHRLNVCEKEQNTIVNVSLRKCGSSHPNTYQVRPCLTSEIRREQTVLGGMPETEPVVSEVKE